MNKIRGIITIVLGIVYVGAIAMVFMFAYQRTVTLNDLRLNADDTAQSMYKLNNTTFNMLYASENLEIARKTWYSTYLETTEKLNNLSLHRGLKYIDPELVKRLSQTNNLWKITTSSFREGNEDLIEFLEKDIKLQNKNNMSSMLVELGKLIKENELDVNPKEKSELSNQYFTLTKSFVSICGANDNLWFYSISTIDALVTVIVKDTNNVINAILFISSFVTIFMFLILVVAIIIRQRILRNSNESLSEKVRERVQSIRNLLDYSGEGFLSFGPDLIIQAEYSRECAVIFGEDIAGKNVAELFYADIQDQTIFDEAMAQVFKGLSNSEAVFEIIDRKIMVDDRIIKLDFHLADESTIICQFNDVTENEFLRKKVEKENARREMILRIVSAKNDFTNIREEAEELFTTINSFVIEGNYTAKKQKNDENIRKINKFEINAKLLRMLDTYNSAYELKTALIEYGIFFDSEPIEPKIKNLIQMYNDEVDFIKNNLGNNWISSAGKLEVKREKLEKTKKLLLEKYPDDSELAKQLDLLTSIKLSALFEKLSSLTQQIANSNGKRIKVNIKCEEIFISNELFKNLSDSAIHILRNMVTHGIEFPGHREKAGKPLSGKIELSAVKQNNKIILNFADDGAGISVEKIKAKAIKAGKVNDISKMTDADFVKMIFRPDFSTADTVTAISGRGYGLSAVKERIYEIGGKIKVTSFKGKGTKFTITVPDSVAV